MKQMRSTQKITKAKHWYGSWRTSFLSVTVISTYAVKDLHHLIFHKANTGPDISVFTEVVS